MGFLGKLLDIFGPVRDIIDEFHTSDEERLDLKAKLLMVQAGVLAEAIQFEKGAIEAQAKVVVAEAASESWITRSWRPIVMLTFTALIVAHWLGIGPAELPAPLWLTIQLGLGGYVGGRSLEKTLPAVVDALKAREET